MFKGRVYTEDVSCLLGAVAGGGFGVLRVVLEP